MRPEVKIEGSGKLVRVWKRIMFRDGKVGDSLICDVTILADYACGDSRSQ